MTGDCHVRFYESLGVRFPRATHQPTEHTAKAAVTPKTGRFATLRGLLHAPRRVVRICCAGWSAAPL